MEKINFENNKTPASATTMNTFQNNIENAINEISKSIKNELFPVGSMFLTVSNINPSSFLGGTWQGFGGGRCLVGVISSEAEFDEPLKTGGEKINSKLYCGDTHYGFSTKESGGASYNDRTIVRSPALSNEHGEISAQISNLQPYITVYFWRRTA